MASMNSLHNDANPIVASFTLVGNLITPNKTSVDVKSAKDANGKTISSNNAKNINDTSNDLTKTTTTTTTQFVTDEPSYSSAALCITLSHLQYTFRPVYTHQIVEQEYWYGYQPKEETILGKQKQILVDEKSQSVSSNNGKALLHKSHRHHNRATKYLDIQVTLSPSCQKCNVQIQTTQSKQSTMSIVVQAEEKKNNIHERQEKQINSISSDDNKDDIRVVVEPPMTKRLKSTTPDNDISVGPANVTETQIMNDLSKALPPIILKEEDNQILIDDYLIEPIGNILHEYSIESSSSSSTKYKDESSTATTTTMDDFIITVADGRQLDVAKYHNAIQQLAIFYIENADNVDVSSTENGGYWTIMYLFQKHTSSDDDLKSEEQQQQHPSSRSRYSLVGYFTLFHFIALFHKPEPGIIVRICQALILPPYQRQGHSQQLMQTLYEKIVHNVTNNNNTNNNDLHKIVQLNVEDPAPGFVALRNKVDYQFVKQHWKELNWLGLDDKALVVNNDKEHSTVSNTYFVGLTESQALVLSDKMKIIPRQIHIVNEIMKLQHILDVCSRYELSRKKINNQQSNDTMLVELHRKFRLMVKKRLNKEHREELSCLASKEEQKARLAELFDQTYQQYQRILKTRQKQEN